MDDSLKPHALIVDDNPSSSMVVEFMLEELGFVSVSMHNSKAVMEHLKAQPYALLVLDWMMPDLDGIELLGLLRANPEQTSLKVVMCSGRSGESDQKKALAAGADDYLQKPLAIDQLRASLKRLELLPS